MPSKKDDVDLDNLSFDLVYHAVIVQRIIKDQQVKGFLVLTDREVCFVPRKDMGREYHRRLNDNWLGRTIPVMRIPPKDPTRLGAVMSHARALAKLQREILLTLKPGQVVDAVVSGYSRDKTAAILTVGNWATGLVTWNHISAYRSGDDVENELPLEERVSAKVLFVDAATGVLRLSTRKWLKCRLRQVRSHGSSAPQALDYSAR